MWQIKDLIGNAEAAAALAAYKEKHAEPADASNDMDVPSGLTQVRALGVSVTHAHFVVWGIGCDPYHDHTGVDVLVHPCTRCYSGRLYSAGTRASPEGAEYA